MIVTAPVIGNLDINKTSQNKPDTLSTYFFIYIWESHQNVNGFLLVVLLSLPASSKDTSPTSIFSSSSSLPTTTKDKKEAALPLSKSISISIDSR